jgi:hypothetical protein
MAFATANVQTGMVFPGFKVFMGDWSGSAGDAPGAISLAGGRVFLHLFRTDDTGSPGEDPTATASVSSGTITLTVYNHRTVTNGRFIVIYS